MCHHRTWPDLVWKMSPRSVNVHHNSMNKCFFFPRGCVFLCTLLCAVSRMRGCGSRNPCNLSDWHPPSGLELIIMSDGNEISHPPFFYVSPATRRVRRTLWCICPHWSITLTSIKLPRTQQRTKWNRLELNCFPKWQAAHRKVPHLFIGGLSLKWLTITELRCLLNAITLSAFM